MRRLKQKWQQKRYGIAVNSSFLQCLCFAHDVLLVGATRAQIRHMLADLFDEAARVGLKLHPGKTNTCQLFSPGVELQHRGV